MSLLGIFSIHWSSFNWLLGILPTWLPTAIMVTGIGLLLIEIILEAIDRVPSIYRLPMRLLALAIFAYGAYIKGRQDVLVEYKQEIDIIKKQQVTVTTKIKNNYVKQIKDIKLANEKLKKTISDKDNADCRLPKSFIELHNNAAKD